MMTFSFSPDNGLSVFRDDILCLIQPTWPDGTAWGSEAEATAWAELLIESESNPDSELPGDNPSTPTKRRVPELPEEKEGFTIFWDEDAWEYVYKEEVIVQSPLDEPVSEEPTPVEEEANA